MVRRRSTAARQRSRLWTSSACWRRGLASIASASADAAIWPRRGAPLGRLLEGEGGRPVDEQAAPAQPPLDPAGGAQPSRLAHERRREEGRAPVDIDIVDGEAGQRDEAALLEEIGKLPRAGVVLDGDRVNQGGIEIGALEDGRLAAPGIHAGEVNLG